jgi:isoleucyl-tRNA synthetase
LFVHGFVVDDDGRKMSKSLGNVVNPANVVSGNAAKRFPAYGADVLR